MAGKRYAILIASSKFPEEPRLAPLRCPENDVDALNEVLSSPEFGQFKTVVFKNAPSYEVMTGIETILADAGGNDLVLIYFSGHGRQMSISGQLCFATADTRLKTLRTTSIPAETIKSLFAEYCAVKNKALILDCCHSGAVGKDFAKGGVDSQLQLMAEGRGTFIMTASTSVQSAFEKEGDAHSLFTKHLLAGIRSGEADRNEDGWVDMAELHEYVRDKIREEGGQQEPLQWHLEASGKLFLSRSGMEAREKRIEAFKKMFAELVHHDKLSPGIALEAAQLLAVPKREMTEKDQKCFLLIEQLHGTKISPPLFMEQWLRTCFAHHAAPKPQEPVIIAAEPVAIVSPSPVPKQGDIMRDEITGMELVYIPAGCFMMGSPEEEEEHQDDEGPVHEVYVDGFWMGKYPVTQSQWLQIMGGNPSGFPKGGRYPVEKVSWDDTQKFIAALNKLSEKAYRLPTEAEWEYACRACGSGKYDLDAVAWHDKNSGRSTHPVGEKQANAFGLHDMLGNIWEWCADWYGVGYYASCPNDNPIGPKSGLCRVVRGNSYGNSPKSVRAADRSGVTSENKGENLGFRLVLPGQQGK